MTDRSDDMSKRDELSFEELMAQSSVGGTTDPVLDHVCTDEEAVTFAAEHSRNQPPLSELRRTADTSPDDSIAEQNNSEICRVETLRAAWSELAAYVREHVCDDQALMAEIMHEAAATFTHYWREKGKLNQQDTLTVLQRAAKLHGRRGRYHDLDRKIDAALADSD